MDKMTKDEKKAQRKEEWQEQLKQEARKQKMTKAGWIGGGVILIIAAFWAIINFTGSSNSSDQQLIDNMPPITSKDLQTGDLKSKVTLTEYADFQCPACGAYHPMVKQLLQAYNGKIHFVYRTFPLTQAHRNAMISAQNAVAAGKQGKFWEMHDMLFEHQADWAELQDPQKIYDGYAEKLGLNMDQFHSDINADATKKFINNEESEGLAIGVNSTPTFFINGKQIQNPTSYDIFKQDIQDAFDK